MASKKTTCEVWICVDACGDYGVGHSADTALAQYAEVADAPSDCSGFRLMKVSVAVPLPQVSELAGEASDEESATLAGVA